MRACKYVVARNDMQMCSTTLFIVREKALCNIE